MTPRPTRRRALAAVGASLVTALAGCRSRPVERGRTLAPSDGAAGDAFGWDVACTGRWTLVGAPVAGERRQGAAYLYDAAAGTERRLVPAAEAGEFGAAVAVDGERALVGAPATGDPDITGAVSVFARTGDQWTRETRLVEPDAASEGYGYDVALAGDRALVGARGTDREGVADAGVAHVYARIDGEWTHRATLAPAAAKAYDYTGGSVGFTREWALLGSFLADAPATDSGAATVFERGSGDWQEGTTLTAPDGAAGDRFGNAVAMDGQRALVGAVGRGGGPDAAADGGGAYVFERGDGGWNHRTTLPGPADDPDAAFGVSVALDGARALVGAFSANGTGPGRAFLFEHAGDGWDRRATLRPANGDPGDGFGSSVALADDRAVVGAVSDGPNGAGTATVFDRS